MLNKFEESESEVSDFVENSIGSRWTLEAIGWTDTYEKITRISIDADIRPMPNESIKFHIFANACVAPKKWLEAPADEDGGYRVYFSDSSKTRRDILVHVFRPLLGDIFSFNVVTQIFDSLGIKNDYEYLLKVSQSSVHSIQY